MAREKQIMAATMTPMAETTAPSTCQYLYGEPYHRDFCGDVVKRGSSYCELHHSKCFTKLDKDRKREVFKMKPLSGVV